MKMLLAALPLLLLGCSTPTPKEYLAEITPTQAERDAFRDRMIASRGDECVSRRISTARPPAAVSARASCECSYNVMSRVMSREDIAAADRLVAGRGTARDTYVVGLVRPVIDGRIARECGVTQ